MAPPTRRPSHSAEADDVAAIILAAGPRGSLPFPKALAPFGHLNALERAVRNCSEAPGYAPIVVVLGSDAGEILAAWKPPEGVLLVNNPSWRNGQITSLRAGLRRVPRNAAFLIYPVDYPLLFTGLLSRLRWAYLHRAYHEQIIAPAMGNRDGHPILVSPELRLEFGRAKTARDVVHRAHKQDRILRVPTREPAIFRDFDSPSAYRLCVRLLRRHFRS